MVWSFFGSCHGKGVHDGAGVVLKQDFFLNSKYGVIKVSEMQKMWFHFARKNKAKNMRHTLRPSERFINISI
jgi:hypothetical protein